MATLDYFKSGLVFTSLVPTFECNFFDSEPELTTKLNNNTHQAQTKVGQMTDYTLHNRTYFGFIFLKIDIAHAKVDINIGK